MSFTSAETRARRQQEVDKAQAIQSRAGIVGGLQYGLFGAGAAALAHYAWPAFRQQTLAGKAFLVSIISIYGFVMTAEDALLAHEHRQRASDGELRRAARIELTQRGLVATETEIRKWIAEREERRRPATTTQDESSAKPS